MSVKVERVQPEIRNDVEFYVSNDGTQTGLSQVGLAKLIGVSESYVRKLLSVRSKRGVFDYYNGQNPDVVSGRAIVLTSNQNARVVTSKACAEIIRLEAQKGNETAQVALERFTEIGFTTWVKTVVGYAETKQLDGIQKTLEAVMGAIGALTAEFQELKSETSGYRKAVIQREGLKEWMTLEESSANEDAQEDPSLLTLAEYLTTQKQTVFTRPQMSYFATTVACLYKSMSLKPPARKRPSRSDGYRAPLTNAYGVNDYPILDLAYKQTVLKF